MVTLRLRYRSFATAFAQSLKDGERERSELQELRDALRFMVMAYDSDADVRAYAGMGDEITFPALRDSLVNSVEDARLTLSKAIAKAEGK